MPRLPGVDQLRRREPVVGTAADRRRSRYRLLRHRRAAGTAETNGGSLSAPTTTGRYNRSGGRRRKNARENGRRPFRSYGRGQPTRHELERVFQHQRAAGHSNGKVDALQSTARSPSSFHFQRSRGLRIRAIVKQRSRLLLLSQHSKQTSHQAQNHHTQYQSRQVHHNNHGHNNHSHGNRHRGRGRAHYRRHFDRVRQAESTPRWQWARDKLAAAASVVVWSSLAPSLSVYNILISISSVIVGVIYGDCLPSSSLTAINL